MQDYNLQSLIMTSAFSPRFSYNTGRSSCSRFWRGFLDSVQTH